MTKIRFFSLTKGFFCQFISLCGIFIICKKKKKVEKITIVGLGEKNQNIFKIIKNEG